MTTDNSSSEEYLTDVVEILRGDGHPVGTVLAADAGGDHGASTTGSSSRRRGGRSTTGCCEDWMLAGVTIIDPASTWIDVTVTIGQDAEIGPQAQLEGATVIGPGAKVGPGCLLEDTTVGEDAVLLHAVCRQAEIGPRATVGPFAYLRPGASIAADAHIGTYVELKKSHVGAGREGPAPHLRRRRDHRRRARTSARARSSPTTTGWRKHHTEVGENAFVGSNTVLVAPVTIGDGAYTAAGLGDHRGRAGRAISA